ncbi:TetR/AcrR family transcriptional regulator [Nocardioides nematodiphilus]|uniref:TetR/AcrR family transcriptional regulator n=1 Tax=Nocardioides nematodiphilus TaxID=2849669 RepID=UPI001CD9D2DE|nr:TetR/AcrR family transcriptional regulator [Nocardioides nematodiphilus]MCA1984111.1 TetR/AcrR family transcriptional regulator [Nocardioides nematodiphilus]
MNLPRPLARPRIEGDREQEILQTALTILGEVGYDRLTMDAVAARAKASKATLYRRWSTKAKLVIDALHATKDHGPIPEDTGSLRGDLQAAFCGLGGLTDPEMVATMGSVITAISRDAEFAREFREQFIAAKVELSRIIWDRAAARGELRPDLDIDLISHAMPGVVLHRVFMLGETATEDLVTRVIDQIVIPAASGPITTTNKD